MFTVVPWGSLGVPETHSYILGCIVIPWGFVGLAVTCEPQGIPWGSLVFIGTLFSLGLAGNGAHP